jgi:hypothetical protein
MLKFVHDDMKLVEIWLTKAESDDDVFRRKLEPIFAEYKKKKYRVVVFSSGKGDMLEFTKDLLKHNLELSVRKELEEEKCR